MNTPGKILATAALLLSCLCCGAQSQGYDVFVPISKYLSQGNADAISAWFAENLDMTVHAAEELAPAGVGLHESNLMLQAIGAALE